VGRCFQGCLLRAFHLGRLACRTLHPHCWLSPVRCYGMWDVGDDMQQRR